MGMILAVIRSNFCNSYFYIKLQKYFSIKSFRKKSEPLADDCSIASSVLIPTLYSVFFLYLFAITVLAWVGDDAFISFRTVSNFINGYGLRWNVDERVQSFTHPLWVILIILGTVFTHNIYYLTLAISIIISMITFAIILFNNRLSLLTRILIGFTLLLSKCYVEYSTSGLENPLTHLLLTLFLFCALDTKQNSRSYLIMALLVALLGTNRIDSILIALPLFTFHSYQHLRSRGLRETIYYATLGFLPLILWEIFALFYFGFLLPNTAYAKLGAAQSRIYLITHGLLYLCDTLIRDSVTFFALLLSIACVVKKRIPFYLFAISGPALYILYVINIGGDFMSGRFLAAPLLASLIVFAHIYQSLNFKTVRYAVVGAFSAMAFSNIAGIAMVYKISELVEGKADHYFFGIVDECAYYKPTNSLMLLAFGYTPVDSHEWAKKGQELRNSNKEKIQVVGTIGMLGYYAGPKVKIIDTYALSDPLLARLPAMYRYDRIGHFERAVPEGYIEGTAMKSNEINNLSLQKYYQRLELIVKGDLLSFERLKEIFKFNLGHYNRYKESYLLDYRVSALEKDILRKKHGFDFNENCVNNYYWDEASTSAWYGCTGPGGSIDMKIYERMKFLS